MDSWYRFLEELRNDELVAMLEDAWRERREVWTGSADFRKWCMEGPGKQVLELYNTRPYGVRFGA